MRGNDFGELLYLVYIESVTWMDLTHLSGLWYIADHLIHSAVMCERFIFLDCNTVFQIEYMFFRLNICLASLSDYACNWCAYFSVHANKTKPQVSARGLDGVLLLRYPGTNPSPKNKN